MRYWIVCISVCSWMACSDDAAPNKVKDGGPFAADAAAPVCDLPDYYVVSPTHELEGSGWHRLFVQGSTSDADDLGRFAMTELRHEVANNDHFLLNAGALVEWVYPVKQALTGRVFGHLARTNDPGVVVRYELYLIHDDRQIEIFAAEDSALGDKGYTPFEACFEMSAAGVEPTEGDRLLLRAINVTGGMLGIVTRAPDYFTWLDVEVR